MSYLIRCTAHTFAGTIRREPRVQYYGRHGMDPTAPLVPFATRDAARAAIAEIDGRPLLLGNGEWCRPTLRAVKASVAPAHVRAVMED